MPRKNVAAPKQHPRSNVPVPDDRPESLVTYVCVDAQHGRRVTFQPAKGVGGKRRVVWPGMGHEVATSDSPPPTNRAEALRLANVDAAHAAAAWKGGGGERARRFKAELRRLPAGKVYVHRWSWHRDYSGGSWVLMATHQF